MTTRLFQTLDFAADALSDLGTPWALVGGLAISAYVEPRFTRDIDIAVSVETDEDAEHFIHSWGARGFAIDTVIEQDATDRLATVRSHRSSASDAEIVVDLLFASSGIEVEIADEARSLEIIPDLVVPVARPAHLFALKLLSIDLDRRPQDLIDLDHLSELIVGAEHAAARQAIELIKTRGYHRGRNLLELFDEYANGPE